MRAIQVSEKAAPFGKKPKARKQIKFRNLHESGEEIARKGQAIYARRVKPQLTQRDVGRFAAIDINSGDFEINGDEMLACDILRERVPNAVVWMERIGSPTLRRFGGFGLR